MFDATYIPVLLAVGVNEAEHNAILTDEAHTFRALSQQCFGFPGRTRFAYRALVLGSEMAPQPDAALALRVHPRNSHDRQDHDRSYNEPHCL